MAGWLAIAILSVSWLWAVGYFAPAQPLWYVAGLVASGALLAGSIKARGNLGPKNPKTPPENPLVQPRQATPPVSPHQEPAEEETDLSPMEAIWWGGKIGGFFFLWVASWFWPWPQKTGPLLMLAGWLGLWLAKSWPLVGRTTCRLSRAALLAGTVLVFQALILEAYQAQTARSHNLPSWLQPVAVGLAKLLDTQAAASDSDLVFRVLGQPHWIGLCWEWLLDPATVLFFTGGVAWLAWRCLESVPAGHRWTCWLAGFRRFCGLIALWIPLRGMLVLGLYLHRAALEGVGGEQLAIAQMFSPWLYLVLLLGPVWLASGCLGNFPAGISLATGRSEVTSTLKAPTSSPPGAVCASPAGKDRGGHLSGGGFGWAMVWVAAGAAVVATAAVWTPIGRTKQGRVLLVERHSQWEPTLRPYDTTWYGEPSGYNYRLIYDCCSHFFQMGRILESEPITEQRLQQCDILIIKTPTAPYQPEEIEAVQRFVANGGSLLLIGDHTNVFRSSTYLNAICRLMGFTFRNDLLFCIGSPYEQKYRRPWPVHPAVQHVGEMDFAVSCSIDPGRSWGRAVIRSTGLWSLPAAYEASNYHPQAEYLPHLRAGAFVQLWATSYGRGRVLAFTDSTIFSNFCIFQPGKAELFLNMLQWLNHTSPLDPWPIQATISWGLGILGLLLAGIGWWKVYPPAAAVEHPSGLEPSPGGKKGGKSKGVGEPAPASTQTAPASAFLPTDGGLAKAMLLLAVAMAGGTVALAAWQAWAQWAMPPLQPQRPYRLAVIDRTVSQTPLANGAFNQSPDGFGLLEHTIPRLGYVTARRKGPSAFDGEVLVVIAPSRSVPHWYREALADYVAQGGHLLVIEHPANTASTANSLLEPFGLQIRHDSVVPAGPLRIGGRSTGVWVDSAWEVSGGEGLVDVAQQPVAARIQYGQGRVLAIGFGQIWSDRQMCPDEWRANWMPEPTPQMLARYGIFYSLFRALTEGGAIKPPELPGAAAGTPEAPNVPEAPPAPEASKVPEVPNVSETPPLPQVPKGPKGPGGPKPAGAGKALPRQKGSVVPEASPPPEAPPVPEAPRVPEAPLPDLPAEKPQAKPTPALPKAEKNSSGGLPNPPNRLRLPETRRRPRFPFRITSFRKKPPARGT